jgi:hypothetical protein
MDTSFWTALNPNIEQLDTRKLMHGKYAYRMAVWAVGCAILRQTTNLDHAIDMRNSSRSYNWAGSWRRSPISTADADKLRHLQKFMSLSDNGLRLDSYPEIKIRIEEPQIHFYSDSFEQLQKIAQLLVYGDNSHFTSIMLPKDPDALAFLLQGYTIRKKDSEWPFRIVIRDGRYSQETKATLRTYLRNLDTEIKVPPNLWLQLDKPGWIWGGYVYVRDSNLATMLTMIDGRLVSKVEEYKTMEGSL